MRMESGRRRPAQGAGSAVAPGAAASAGQLVTSAEVKRAQAMEQKISA